MNDTTFDVAAEKVVADVRQRVSQYVSLVAPPYSREQIRTLRNACVDIIFAWFTQFYYVKCEARSIFFVPPRDIGEELFKTFGRQLPIRLLVAAATAIDNVRYDAEKSLTYEQNVQMGDLLVMWERKRWSDGYDERC